MTIDEAIKTSSHLDSHIKGSISPYLRDAIKLGIEALKREKARREGLFTMVGELLPSETKD